MLGSVTLDGDDPTSQASTFAEQRHAILIARAHASFRAPASCSWIALTTHVAAARKMTKRCAEMAEHDVRIRNPHLRKFEVCLCIA
eukprot:2836781-Prymnesium_polylepis.1